MVSRVETSIPLESLTIRRRAMGTIAVVGNPNAGKSSVFNRLTGLRQKTANYPGVTVERRLGRGVFGDTTVDLIDLPGTYSLSPNSTDERIAVEVLFGRVLGTPRPEGILAVIDATRLYQGLYLLQQLVELGRPMIVALTMTDAAQKLGMKIDIEQLQAALGGVQVFPIVATTGRGFGPLKEALGHLLQAKAPKPIEHWRALRETATRRGQRLSEAGVALQHAEVERLLVDGMSPLPVDDASQREIARARTELFGDEPPLAVEARQRYRWIRETLSRVETPGSGVLSHGAVLLDWINRPWPATALFIVAMAVVFQAVFAWATPFMDLIDAGVSGFGSWLTDVLPPGMLTSFLADGVVAGVGSVIICSSF
jgi:ferrous iron transport protein B